MENDFKEKQTIQVHHPSLLMSSINRLKLLQYSNMGSAIFFFFFFFFFFKLGYVEGACIYGPQHEKFQNVASGKILTFYDFKRNLSKVEYTYSKLEVIYARFTIRTLTSSLTEK